MITASPPPSSPPVGMSTVRTIFFNLLAQLKGQPDENRDSISIQLILPPSKYPLPPYIPLKQNVLILCFCHPLPYYWNQVQNLESAQATLSLSLKLSISNTSHHLNPIVTIGAHVLLLCLAPLIMPKIYKLTSFVCSAKVYNCSASRWPQRWGATCSRKGATSASSPRLSSSTSWPRLPALSNSITSR